MYLPNHHKYWKECRTPHYLAIVWYVHWLAIRSRIKLNVFFMCASSCDQTYNGQNNSILPFLNAKYFYAKHIFNLFSFFWKQNSLNIPSESLIASGSFMCGGSKKILAWPEAESLSCWTEQSRQACWGWKSGASFTRSVCSSYTLDCGSSDLGTPFAKGDVQTVTHTTHTGPS